MGVIKELTSRRSIMAQMFCYIYIRMRTSIIFFTCPAWNNLPNEFFIYSYILWHLCIQIIWWQLQVINCKEGTSKYAFVTCPSISSSSITVFTGREIDAITSAYSLFFAVSLWAYKSMQSTQVDSHTSLAPIFLIDMLI